MVPLGILFLLAHLLSDSRIVIFICIELEAGTFVFVFLHYVPRYASLIGRSVPSLAPILLLIILDYPSIGMGLGSVGLDGLL